MKCCAGSNVTLEIGAVMRSESHGKGSVSTCTVTLEKVSGPVFESVTVCVKSLPKKLSSATCASDPVPTSWRSSAANAEPAADKNAAAATPTTRPLSNTPTPIYRSVATL